MKVYVVVTSALPTKADKNKMSCSSSDEIEMSNHSITVHRPIFTQKNFDGNYNARHREEDGFKFSSFKRKFNRKSIKSFVLARLPFLQLVRSYELKNLWKDCVAGITVGIMNIPQGMAYALLAGLPAVYGLYTSLFPPLIYFFFGTSRHISLGTFAVMSLMILDVVEDTCTHPLPLPPVGSNETLNTTINEDDCHVSTALSLTMMVGIIQMLMSLLQVGCVSVYLSQPLTSAFTCGAGFHVLTSQLKNILGLNLPRRTLKVGKIFLIYYDIFTYLPEANFVAALLFAGCFFLLLVVKEFLNPCLKPHLKMPIPVDLFVIIFAAVLSQQIEFNKHYDVPIVNAIEIGIPSPSLVQINYELIWPALSIAIVGFAISYAQAKIFARKHNYAVCSNQELLSLGIVNTTGACFNCFVSAASLSRSLVQESVGGVTQLTSLVSCLLVLTVILWLAPFFYHLPLCALSAIIVVALKSVLLQLLEVRTYWKVYHMDMMIWLITFMATIGTSVAIGLIVGVSVSVLTIISRAQRPYVCLLGQVPGTDIYRDTHTHPSKVKELPSIKILRFDASLFFANCEYFSSKLRAKASVSMDKSLQHVQFIIVDCSTMAYVDSMGVSMLKQTIEEFRQLGVTMYLAACKADVRRMLETDTFSVPLSKDIQFIAVHDAVLAAMLKMENSYSASV